MITAQELRDKLKGAPSIRAIARETGLSEKTLYRTANGQTEPSLETARLILQALSKTAKRGTEVAG